MSDRIWTEDLGEGPLVSIALHDGHRVREDVRQYLTVSGDDRLREEDPFTAQWTRMAPSRVVGTRSRFEVDLNRPPDRAIYRAPDDAWGLGVWRPATPDEVFATSLGLYNEFYTRIEELLAEKLEQFPKVVVFDLHTYNHRRPGPHRRAAPAEDNPQVDVGTFVDERAANADVVDTFISQLQGFDFPGGALDVRENVRFPIGPFAEWAHRRFPGKVCALSVEVKKFFMDEWTGVADSTLLESLGMALEVAADGVGRVLRGEEPTEEDLPGEDERRADPAPGDEPTILIRR